MEFKERLLREIVAGPLIAVVDEEYAGVITGQADDLEKDGVYSSVADVVNPRSGATHVDLGSGDCRLLEHLKKREPNVVAIGVECFSLIVEAARRRIESLGIPFFVISKSEEAESFHLESHSDAVVVVQEDIRSARLLNKLLKNRAIDSSSLMFPTPSMKSFFDSSHRQTRSLSLAESVMVPIRRAAYKVMTRRTKPNGIAIIADGKGLEIADSYSWSGTATVRSLFGMLGTDMGEYSRFWTPEKIGMSQGKTSGGLSLVPIDENRSTERTNAGFCFFAALRRNERRIKSA